MSLGGINLHLCEGLALDKCTCCPVTIVDNSDDDDDDNGATGSTGCCGRTRRRRDAQSDTNSTIAAAIPNPATVSSITTLGNQNATFTVVRRPFTEIVYFDDDADYFMVDANMHLLCKAGPRVDSWVPTNINESLQSAWCKSSHTMFTVLFTNARRGQQKQIGIAYGPTDNPLQLRCCVYPVMYAPQKMLFAVFVVCRNQITADEISNLLTGPASSSMGGSGRTRTSAIMLQSTGKGGENSGDSNSNSNIP